MYESINVSHKLNNSPIRQIIASRLSRYSDTRDFSRKYAVAWDYQIETRVIPVTTESPAVRQRRGWSCGSCWPSGSWPQSASASSGAHCPLSSESLWPRTSARLSSQARPVAFKVSAIIAIAIIKYKSSIAFIRISLQNWSYLCTSFLSETRAWWCQSPTDGCCREAPWSRGGPPPGWCRTSGIPGASQWTAAFVWKGQRLAYPNSGTRGKLKTLSAK